MRFRSGVFLSPPRMSGCGSAICRKARPSSVAGQLCAAGSAVPLGPYAGSIAPLPTHTRSLPLLRAQHAARSLHPILLYKKSGADLAFLSSMNFRIGFSLSTKRLSLCFDRNWANSARIKAEKIPTTLSYAHQRHEAHGVARAVAGNPPLCAQHVFLCSAVL